MEALGRGSFSSVLLLLMNKPFSPRTIWLRNPACSLRTGVFKSGVPVTHEDGSFAVNLHCDLGWTTLSALGRMITYVFKLSVTLACQLVYVLCDTNEEVSFGYVPVIVFF